MKSTVKGTLLIVDGDPRSRRAAEVGLRHAGHRVTIAGSPEQALWFLERATPDAVLTVPHFDGEALGWDLVRILRSRPDGARMAVVVLMTDPGDRVDPTADLADDLLPWPAGVRELEARVRQVLIRRRVANFLVGSGERRLAGDLDELSPIDLLTLIHRAHATGTLEIEGVRGPATLWFIGGQIVDGQFGRFAGEEAIFQILVADSGPFEWTMKPIVHAPAITAPMTEIISESLRRLDEWTRLCDELPELGTALRIDPQRLRARGATLSAEQVALVERCTGKRAIREVVDDSEIDPLLALEVLRNLLEVGVVVPAGRPEERASVARGVMVDVGELPPLPAFPEPFPGTAEEGGLDAPLVSGIPEDPGEFVDLADEGPLREPSEASRAVSDALLGPRTGSPYVFRSPLGREAGKPAPGARRVSVRVPLVGGRVEPPMGVQQAEATGELELTRTADDRSDPSMLRRRQSILFHRVPALSGQRRETVRSSRHDFMSPSGLISAGELVVEEGIAPAANTPSVPRSSDDEPSIAGTRDDRTGRWAEEGGPEALLLPESLDDLGRLSAMAAVFTQGMPEASASGAAASASSGAAASASSGAAASASSGAAASASSGAASRASSTSASNTPSRSASGVVSSSASRSVSGSIPATVVSAANFGPTSASSGSFVGEARQAPAPLLRPPEPIDEETPLIAELRQRWWVLAIACVLVIAALVALRRPRTTTDDGPATTPRSREITSALEAPAPTRAPAIGAEEAVTGGAAPSAGATLAAATANAATELDAPAAPASPPPPEPTERSASEREALAAAFADAEALYRRGKLDRAHRGISGVLALDPGHVQGLVLLANISLEQGELDAAEVAAKAAIEREPTLAEAFLTLGVIAQEKKSPAEALAAYERYLELAPDARYASSVRRQVSQLRRTLP